MNNLNPKYFFLGVIIAVLGLATVGRYATFENSLVNFSRFYPSISAEAQYFFTSKQLMALSHAKLSKDKISVIIGGSSNMRGAGQSQRDLWSSVLQKKLGDKYQVLNLAMNGGGPGGQALYMAEALSKEGYKVIFMADIMPFGVAMSPANSEIYRGMFFDALARGYVKPFPERIDYVNKILFAQKQDVLQEQQLKARLNSYLNFNDLWTYVGYEYFFSIWTNAVSSPWRPKKKYEDSEPNCTRGLSYQHYLDEEMRIVRGGVNAPPLGTDIDQSLSATIPSALQGKTLLIVKPYSPFYLKRLSRKEQTLYVSKLSTAQTKYKTLGISTILTMLNFNEDDYCDRDHLSEAGGKKLANYVAPFVIKKARELDYE